MSTHAGPRLSRAKDDTSFDVIKRSHSLSGDTGHLDDFYRDWAASYDADVTDQGYLGPAMTTALAVDVTPEEAERSRTTVLDAGCGTGLVGVELARAGFGSIDGIDLSHPMVDRARDTGTYRHLTGGIDLNHPVECVEPETYDLLVCCGVFTVGHVEARALDHLVEVVRPGGVLIISTRLSYLHRSGFSEHLGELAETGKISLLRTEENGPYIDEEAAKYWVLSKDR
ncbi:class I SAM-dependent methyltransferase [Streptomyces enissocaesilis]|uniref:Class I SAM-dependent methyltransferase n=1 Tax=Streptomyces enissocaesilis TaxID=332589 RepID=A0ABN3XL85_9ACTN